MKKPHYQWLCEEIEQALSESELHVTPEAQAKYRRRLKELTGRATSHMQDYIKQMRVLSAGPDES